MKRYSWRYRISAILLFAEQLVGSGPSATLLGTVTDQTGRVIVEATVFIRNSETNALRQLNTSNEGLYSAPLLSPGFYSIVVEAPNFQPAERRGIKLDVNDTVQADFMLQLAQVMEVINVRTAAPLVHANSAVIGNVIDRNRVTELPLNERNFLSFTLLVPGVQSGSEGSQASTQGIAVSVNGAREQSNNFLLDGVDNNDLQLNQYSVLPSLEAIEEFRVQSSTSSAEFGRSGGAQVNVILRSGTNSLHGSAFWFVRNRHLDARNFFDKPACTPGAVVGTCGEIPRYDRSQFGGTVGGPLRKDKAFVFLSYEGLRLREAVTRQATVPSIAEREAVLGGIPASAQNPAGLAAMQLYPAPNVGPDLRTSNRVVASPTGRFTLNQYLAKWTWLPGDNDQVSLYYALTDGDRYNPYDLFFAYTNLPGYGTFYAHRGQAAGFTWSRALSGLLVNEARLGFNRLSYGVTQESAGRPRAQELGFPDVTPHPSAAGYPNLTIVGFDSIGEPTNAPQKRSDNTYQLSETLAWNPSAAGGRHLLKFGGEVRRFQSNIYLDYIARGIWQFLGLTGTSLQDLVLGLPAFAVTTQGDTFATLETTAYNAFVQDDWRLHPRLTLNLGLRYEYNSPPVEAHDRLSAPDTSARSATCTPIPDCQFIRAGTGNVPRATFRSDRNNLAPRIGLVWRPFASDTVAVRSAYGIFYDVAIANLSFAPRLNPPFFSTQLFLNNGTQNIQSIVQQPATFSPVAVFAIDPNYRDAYMQQWNADLQWTAPQALVLGMGYVGSKGTGLLLRTNPNQPRPGALPPMPQFAPFQFGEPAASSIYHSFQLRAERRLVRGLTFLAAYTWSKSIDDASAIFGTFAEPGLPQDSFNRRDERAPSNFDARHRLSVSYRYELPFGGGDLSRGWLNGLVRGWIVGGITTLQSGRPFTANRAIDQSGTGPFNLTPTDRPDQIADPFQPGPVPHHSDPACRMTVSQGGRAVEIVRDPSSWFNPCAFAAAPGRFGSAGRNTLVGPGFLNFDIALLKDFRWSESKVLQFRLETFNAANHPQFDIPDRIFDSPTFGKVRSANGFGNKPPRQIQVALKYMF